MNAQPQRTLLEEAHELGRQGLYVFPLQGKRPCQGSTGFKEAETMPTEIEQLFSRYPQATDIGIWPGGSHLLVVDIDEGKTIGSTPAILRLHALFLIHGTPDTLTVRTGGGGRHLYFLARSQSATEQLSAKNGVFNPETGKTEAGVDARGTGGYLVAPPSIHPVTKRPYEWVGGFDATRIKSIEDYPWLLDFLLARRAPSIRTAPLNIQPTGDIDSKRAHGILRTACERLSSMVNGRYDFARDAARNCAGYCWAGLNASDVRAQLLAAGMQAGYKSEYQLLRGIDWGIEQGLASPQKFPPNSDDFTAPRDTLKEDAMSLSHLKASPAVAKEQPAQAAGILLSTKAAILASLKENKAGPLSSQSNISQVISQEPAFQDIWRNTFSLQIMVGDTIMTDSHLVETDIWLANNYDISRAGITQCGVALAYTADLRPRDPLQEHLSALQWDGQPRAAKMLSTYFSVEDTPLSQAYSRKFLLSCVARAFRPGCKVDTLLILAGHQGAMKSSGIEALCGPDWFSDSDFDMSNKDAYLQIQGKWIYELGELNQLRGKASQQAKQFLASRKDNFRAPFGRNAKNWPRRVCFVGTTNQREFLHDETGERRYWPVTCAGQVDYINLAKDRDQIWAEVVHWMRDGLSKCGVTISDWADLGYQAATNITRSDEFTGKWWLNAEEMALHATDTNQYKSSHPWQDKLDRYITGTHARTAHRREDLFSDALDVKNPTSADGRQLARCMRILGWQRSKSRLSSPSGKDYVFTRLSS